MNASATIGLIKLPQLAALCQQIGVTPVTGDDYRAAATSIRAALETKGPFPILVSDEQWPGLRAWTEKSARETRVVVLRVAHGVGHPFNGVTDIALPATVGEVMAAAGVPIPPQVAHLVVDANGNIGQAGEAQQAAPVSFEQPVAPAQPQVPVDPWEAQEQQPVFEAPVETPAPFEPPVAQQQPVFAPPVAQAPVDPWEAQEQQPVAQAPVDPWEAQEQASFEPPVAPAVPTHDPAQPVFNEQPVSFEQPVQPEPVFEQPVAPVVPTQPVFNEPVSFEAPTQPEPVFEQPVQPEPVFERPVSFEAPTQPEPVFEQPVQPEPVFDQPVAPAVPTHDPAQPVFNEPTQPEPVFEQPVSFEAPAQPEPVFDQPVAPAVPTHDPAQPVFERPVQPEPVAPAPPVETPVTFGAPQPAFSATPEAAPGPVAVTPRPRQDGLADVIIVWAGKGGVGKSTCSFSLAQRAAKAGLRVILVDANHGQGDIRTFLRIGNAGLPSIYQAAISGDIRQSLIDPDTLNESRSLKLDPLGFAVVQAPPAHLADPDIVTPEAYTMVVEQARDMCDLVIVDTQIIESLDGTGMRDRFVVPLLRSGAWSVGLTDLSSPGISNLVTRLKAFAAAGVPRENHMTAMNRIAREVPFNLEGVASAFNELSTFLGVIHADNAIPENMNRGRAVSSLPVIAPVLDAALSRVTGRTEFSPDAEAAAAATADLTDGPKTKGGLFSRFRRGKN